MRLLQESRGGLDETGNERREVFVQLSNSPTQARVGLEWATLLVG
jgi:hypothetical protein